MLIAIGIYWATVAFVTMIIALDKGYNPFFWFFVGTLPAGVGLVAAIFLPELPESK
ncbi:MAG: hypothetical protein KAS07_03070 [Candidatus Pacebacteria bacterium]|nr:hypothetical protein [Candidatus Paceibacterota bacterium]